MESKMKKLRMILVLALALALLFSGCGNSGGGSGAADTAGGGQDSTADPAAGSGEDSTADEFQGFSLDNYGREVVISKRPEKVLTLGPNCTELFIALGLGDRIIGNSLDNHSRGALPEYQEQYGQVPELNYSSATREAVISSGADFVYGIDWEFGDAALDIAELEQYGMTVYVNQASTLEEIYQEIEDIGRIFGVEEAAASFIAGQKERIEAVSAACEGKEPLKVLIYDSGNDGVFTCGGTNFESLLIGLAGGENIFSDLTDRQWTTVSYEEVLAREPEVIVIHDYDSPSVEEKIAEIKSNPSLAGLACVQEERFVIIALESVLPGDRMAYAVETLHQGLYGEAD